MSLDESILNSVDESPVTKALEKERSDLCNLLFECNRLLGDLCCRYVLHVCHTGTTLPCMTDEYLLVLPFSCYNNRYLSLWKQHLK